MSHDVPTVEILPNSSLDNPVSSLDASVMGHADPLERARQRLEQALSRLTNDGLLMAKALKEARARLQTLEQQQKKLHDIESALERVELDNLRLEESLAHSEIKYKSQNETLETLKHEKTLIEKNYALLRHKQDALQADYDAIEATQRAQKAQNLSDDKDRTAFLERLQKLEDRERKLLDENNQLREEREAIRHKLDHAIAQVEQLVNGGA